MRSRSWSACPGCRSGWWRTGVMPATPFASTSGPWARVRRSRPSRTKPRWPAKQNEAPVACPEWVYANRNYVERLWARLKEWRAVATRYEKTASSFMGVLYLAAALDWIKAEQALEL